MFFQTIRTLRCAIHALNTILMVPALLRVAAARFADRWTFQVVHPSSLSSDVLKAPEANICSCYLHFVSMYGAFMLHIYFPRDRLQAYALQWKAVTSSCCV
jgi:hypothetical protein